MLEIIQLPVLEDNYIYLLHDPHTLKTAVVDPAVAQPVLDRLTDKGWQLDYIFNTHHHWDHVGANLALKKQTGCQILASQYDNNRIPGIDQGLHDQQQITLGSQTAIVMVTPGHTLGHIVYYFPDSYALFCGDTLFSLGCGRLFEGSPEQMWQSLQMIKSLPPDTQIYCAHEYTQSNAKFALTLEPDNRFLLDKIQQINQLRANNLPTVPSTLEQELSYNPFLREDSPAIRQSIGLSDHSSVEVFAKIRQLKDNW